MLAVAQKHQRPSRWPFLEGARRDLVRDASMLACQFVRDHSRKPSTRAEARKLLEILERR